jgi:hypothetical protein
VTIVAEHAQVVPGEETIGRIAVYNVDLAGVERLVLHRRQQRVDIAKVQPVGRGEARQPVGAPDEIRRESRP